MGLHLDFFHKPQAKYPSGNATTAKTSKGLLSESETELFSSESISAIANAKVRIVNKTTNAHTATLNGFRARELQILQ